MSETENTMTQDPLLAFIRDIVTAGERLRMELLTHLRQADPDEQNAVRVELMMFYGQAFAKVEQALSRPLEPGTPSVSVLFEAIQGMVVFRRWQETQTSVNTWRDLDRLTEHWEQITVHVLGERG